MSSSAQTAGSRQVYEQPHARGKWWLHGLLIAFSAVMLTPFLLMVVVSLIPQEVLFSGNIQLSDFTLANYPETFSVVPFGRYYFNSIVVTFSVLSFRLIVASMAGFAFSRLRFRGRDLIFNLYIATLMIPIAVTLIPRFLIAKELGWYDNFSGLIIPSIFNALSVFLLRQYYRGIPMDYDEAARMDGASSLRIWWQIIMPLSWPVLGTLLILGFQDVWNDFLWPLVITASENMRTIPVGLSFFVGQYSTAWGLLMAGAVVALLPVLVIYLLAQNAFVKGISLSGIGGR
jgi:multiple sugar transport system permease protein